MITGLLFFALILIAIILIFIFGILKTILGLALRVTGFGVRVVVGPLISLLAIIWLLSLLL